MIPLLRPERILSRCVFEVNFGAINNNNSSELFPFNDVFKEITRLLPPLLTTHISSSSSSSTTLDEILKNLFVVLNPSQNIQKALSLSDSSSKLVEIRDTRIAAFLCDILQERRVLRLSSGNNCQVSWCVGVEGNAEFPLYNLPESNARSEDELRMNTDEELWAQTTDRRQNVINWLNMYAPISSNTNNIPQFSLERLEAAFIKATNTMFSSAHNVQSILDKDPFQNGFFLGAFDKQGNATIISSLLPVLSNDVKPSAKALATAISKTKNVYFRSLCLIYLRYRLNPENISLFFGPSQFEGTSKTIAPSYFSALGKIYDEGNIIPGSINDSSTEPLCPILDTSLIQTSFDGSTTITMKEFSRSLLTEDELVEFWLPTYSKFAVERLNNFILKVDQVQQEKIFLKQQQQQQINSNKNHHNNNPTTNQLARRGRNEDNNNNDNNQKKPKNTADSAAAANNNINNASTSSVLPSGIKSMAHFAALMKEQAVQQREQREQEKREQEEKDRLLREKFAGTLEEQLQKREIFQREAAALKDRRRREVLDRLKTTADAKDKSNAFSSLLTISSQQSNNNNKNYSAVDSKTAELIFAMTSSSTNESKLRNQINSFEVVDGNLLNRSVVYFASHPPPFASLPPFAGGNSNNANKDGSALSQLCSNSTVGTEDMFVCF